MEIGLFNLTILFGLAAVAIPPLLHLLRRRHDVIVDWGAMQFLPSSSVQRRRRMLDELLLMLLRMFVIGVLVLALASPYAAGNWLGALSDRGGRDTVLVVDGSYSMAARGAPGATPGDAARRWAQRFIADLPGSDRVALVLARRPPVVVQAELSGDRHRLASALDALGEPRGNPDVPAALQAAWELLLEQGAAPDRQLLLLTDRQYHGLADAAALAQWEALGDLWRPEIERRRASGEPIPRLQLVDFAAPAQALPNVALAPLMSARGLAVIGHSIRFQSALHLASGPERPPRVVYEVDGEVVAEISLGASSSSGRVPVAFSHRFTVAGSHLVGLKADAADALAADNQQYTVVDVRERVPVLLVDGDPKLSTDSSTFFLQRALTPADGPAAAPRAIAAEKWTAAELRGPDAPAVVVLSDVPELSPTQEEALESYLGDGGSLLVVAGERIRRAVAFYNERLYRQGRGWLPAPLVEAAGGGGSPAQLDMKSLADSPLSLLVQASARGPGEPAFPRWWKVHADGVRVLASLSTGDPLLVEKPYRKGHVVLCTAPLDRRWDSALPSTWEYPVLVNELVAYLARPQGEAYRIGAGAPLSFQPAGAAALPAEISLTTPDGQQTRARVVKWPWTHADSGAIGPYRVQAADATAWFVVPPDAAEADLRRASDAELQAVLDRLPDEVRPRGDETTASRHDIWWLCLLAVVLLLCGEAWMTRRVVAARLGRAGE